MTEQEELERAERAKKYERGAFSLSPRVSSDKRASLLDALPASWRQYPHFGLIVLLVLAAAFYLFIAFRYPIQRSDDVYYWVGAKSLAMGKGYADITRPDMPLLTKYAPLASLTQAPFTGLAGFDIAKLRLVGIFYLLLTTVLAYIVLLERCSKRTALFCLALFLLHQTPIQMICLQGNQAVGIGIVWAIWWLVETRFKSLTTGKFAPLLGIFLGISFYYHRSYIAIALATFLFLALARRWRDLIVALGIYAGMAFPWMWRSYTHTGHWMSPEYESEIQGRIREATLSGPVNSPLQATVEHMLVNLKDVPFEIGHRLFPWSRPTFGNTWPFLENNHLGWLGTVSIYGVFLLVLLGLMSEMRQRSKEKPPVAFTEICLLGLCGTLLVFFFSMNYLLAFLPWLYLYLLRGTQHILSLMRLRKSQSTIVLCGWVIVALVLLGKNAVVYVLPRGGTVAQNIRWQWVMRYVPSGETVYYENLDNYAMAQWRYIDTERYAIGLTTAQIQTQLAENPSPLRYLSVAQGSPLEPLLQKNGWTPRAEEPHFDKQAFLQSQNFMTPAQRDYIAQMEPPQRFWIKSTNP
jgi:hypothetical protein